MLHICESDTGFSVLSLQSIFTSADFTAHSIQIAIQLGHKIEADYSKNRYHVITTQTKEKNIALGEK